MFNRSEVLKVLTSMSLLASPLAADQVMKVEEMLAKKNDLKVDFSLSYSNIDTEAGMATSIPITTSSGLLGLTQTQVNIPAYAGDKSIDQDYFSTSLSVRYGLTSDIEVMLFGSAHTSASRITRSYEQTLLEHASTSESGFDSVGIGFTYKIKDEGKYPSLLFGATTNVMSRLQYIKAVSDTEVQIEKSEEYFDSYNAYLLSYYTVDPIVFVMKLAYQWSPEQTNEESSIDNGEIVTVAPSIYFAVNPYTNLNWGVTYQYTGSAWRNGVLAANSGSALGFNFGVSYEIARNNIMSIEASKSDGAAYTQSAINLLFSKSF